MAREVTIGSAVVKIRNPFLVFVWALVTLGIYYVVWYYKVNRELRDACGIAVSPGVALLAIFPGSLIIVPPLDRKSTRLNSSHGYISYAVFCLKQKTASELR